MIEYIAYALFPPITFLCLYQHIKIKNQKSMIIFMSGKSNYDMSNQDKYYHEIVQKIINGENDGKITNIPEGHKLHFNDGGIVKGGAASIAPDFSNITELSEKFVKLSDGCVDNKPDWMTEEMAKALNSGMTKTIMNIKRQPVPNKKEETDTPDEVCDACQKKEE